VAIALEGEFVVAHVEGAAFAVARPPRMEPRLGLYLDGTLPAARLADSTLPEPYLALARGIQTVDATQGWRHIRVQDGGGAPLFEHDFARHGTSGWAASGGAWFLTPDGVAATPLAGFIGTTLADLPNGARIDATLARGRAGAIAVGSDGRAGGVLVMVRPEHRDVILWRLDEGHWQGPIGGGPYARPWLSAVKDLLRHLLSPYLIALVVGMVFLLIGHLWQTARRSDPRIGESDRPPADRWALLAAVAIAALTTVSALLVADLLLERIPHVQDSVGYLFQAKVFAAGRLWAPVPPVPEAFWHEFIVMDETRWFAKYPPGFPMILALGVLAGFPWVVNPILAGMASLLLFRLGSAIDRPMTGVVAASLFLISPFALGLNGSFMAHTAGLAFLLLFLLGYAHSEGQSRGASLVAGAAFGIALLIRPWTAIVFGIPFAVDLAYRFADDPRRSMRQIALLGAGAAPFLGLWFGYNTVMAGGPLHNTMELWWSFDRLGFGPDRGLGGHTPFGGLLNTLRNVAEMNRHLFGWPGALTLMFALVPFALGRASRWDRLLLASAACVMVGYFFWWADGVMYGPRFYFEAMGPLLLLSGRGLHVLAQAGSAPGRVLAPAMLVVLVAGATALYLPPWIGALNGYNYVHRGPVSAVERSGISDALVLVDPGSIQQWWNYGMVFSANSPFLDNDVIYARATPSVDLAKLRAAFPERRIVRLVADRLIPAD